MPTPSCTISLADLTAAGIHLHPSEAVAVAHEVVRRAREGQLPGIPSASVVRFGGDGIVTFDGPIAPGASVENAGRLLDAMLPGFDAPAELRVPGALRLVVARALGTLDVPPYASLAEFGAAIARFAAPDLAAVVRALCESWTTAVSVGASAPAAAPPPSAERSDTATPLGELTISDVRRARRSTGLTLSEIADRSRIPVSLLRELEWGYFINWPAGHYGRIQLVRYARAAGLDEDVVLRAVWPVLQDAIRMRAARVVQGTVEPDVTEPDALVKTAGGPPVRRTIHHSFKPRPVLATISIAALLVVAMLPALWNSAPSVPEPARQTSGGSAVAPVESPSSAAPAATNDRLVAPTPGSARGRAGRTAVPAARTLAAEVPVAKPAVLQTDVGFSPAFASTGSAMFYHSARSGDSAIMRADTDEAGAVLRVTRVVSDGAQNFHARPSPDGRLIAFDSDREGERAVYLADANGENVRRVTGEGFAAVPSWSPDGRRLAFIRAERDHPKVWNLWLLDIETGDTTRLTSHRVGQPWGAAWFPDGERIAYSHETRLVVRSLDGRSEQIFPSPKKGALIRTPAVSPDGRRVMFQVRGDGAWLLDLEDASMIRVLADPSAEEFTWSPGGERVAYHSRKEGAWNVWVMAPR